MEENKAICRNPWCKGTFFYTECDLVLSDNGDKMPPIQCPKCRSFSEELSGGVEWKEKRYEGSRMDGMPHQIDIKVKKFFK